MKFRDSVANTLLLIILVSLSFHLSAQDEFLIAPQYTTGYGPRGAVAGDFNGDGRPDLAVADGIDSNVRLLLNSGTGTFQQGRAYATGLAPHAITAADFDGDGKLDLAVANASSRTGNTVSLLLGNGDGTFQKRIDYVVGLNPYSIVAGDFNGDGHPDIATANYVDNTVSVLLGNGNGSFQPHVDLATGKSPDGITAGDTNGDGKLDLVVADSTSNSVSVLAGNGDGTFRAHVDYATGTKPHAVALGDLNGGRQT